MPSPIVDLIYLPLALLYLPILLYQMIVLKKNRRGWRERFGGVPVREGDRRCIWIHGVSLGEVNATPTLIAELKRRLPDVDVVISSTTDTGYAAANRHYPNQIVFRFPLDFSFALRRVFRRIRPDAIVLMELEIWPNLLRLTSRRGIPVGIANGRITEEKSMRRFSKPIVRNLARDMVSKLAWIAAQDETYAERFRRLGAPDDRVIAAGSLKFDTAVVADEIDGDRELARAMGIATDAPLIVAGSTGPGEEPILLDAYDRLRETNDSLQLAIIPRKPERFDEVARQIESRGYGCIRRSARPNGANALALDQTNSTTTIFLGDTMGELRKFYSLATVVFIGRSLVPMGGSDLMEVAALAKPMCYGPHVENFADMDRQLTAVDAAVKVTDADTLARTFAEMLKNTPDATERGRRARQVVLENQGATVKIADLICESLSNA